MSRIVLALLVSLGLTGIAKAETYPARPITVIVPFGAGGPIDRLARLLTESMRTTLGQPIVVENVTGASGLIGVGRVVRAAPDGYTLGIGNWPSHVLAEAALSPPFNTLKDLEPVALLPSNPYVIIARKDFPAKTASELIAWLKKNPGKATLGTAGPGSGQHLAGLYFQNVTKTDLQFVPYRGGASDIVRDLIAGHIDLAFEQAITALPYLQSGSVTAYAVTSPSRIAAAANIPTADEAGASGLHILIWNGMWVPKGTQKPIIEKLTGAAMAAMADPSVRARLVEWTQEIPPVDQQNASALGARHKADAEKWWPLVKAATPK